MTIHHICEVPFFLGHEIVSNKSSSASPEKSPGRPEAPAKIPERHNGFALLE
jgi:hypothetical protein